jgi:hypothetical protein
LSWLRFDRDGQEILAYSNQVSLARVIVSST